jgi:hypothetical protein
VIEEREEGSGVLKAQHVWSPVYVDALVLSDLDIGDTGDVSDDGDCL